MEKNLGKKLFFSANCPSTKFLFGLSAALFWAFAIVASRFIYNQGESPFTLVFWSSIGAIPVWFIHTLRHQNEMKKVNGKVLMSLLIIGLIGSVGISLMEGLALKHTTAVNFAFLIRMIVVFTIFFAWIFFKEPVTPKKLILVGLILTGSFLLVTKGGGVRLQLGDIFTLIEAATVAFVNNILIKFTVSQIHPDLSAALSFFVGLIPITIFAYLNGGLRIPISWLVVFLVVVCDILLVQFRNRAYKVASASFVTMIMSFTPVITAGLSFTLLNESLLPIQLFGGSMIVLAGIFAEKLKI
jgi:drug/metabolite transporter (DMT)-like permease